MKILDTNGHAGRRGFTLIEILLAMLITSIIILGINSAYRQAHLVWSNAENQQPVYHDVRVITETLRQELSCLYMPPKVGNRPMPFALTYSPNEQTELTFCTLTPSWKSDPGSSRAAKVRYRFRKDPDTEETSLERFEQPFGGEKAVGKESADLIVKGLSAFTVFVLDPNSDSGAEAWKQSYGSKEVPPKAVRVLLKWAPNDTTPEATFMFCTMIPCDSVVF